jgi:hypothetical protein
MGLFMLQKISQREVFGYKGETQKKYRVQQLQVVWSPQKGLFTFAS